MCSWSRWLMRHKCLVSGYDSGRPVYSPLPCRITNRCHAAAVDAILQRTCGHVGGHVLRIKCTVRNKSHCPVSNHFPCRSTKYRHNKTGNVQGGSNMTGTNCDLFTHKQCRSYLNHLVRSSYHATVTFTEKARHAFLWPMREAHHGN